MAANFTALATKLIGKNGRPVKIRRDLGTGAAVEVGKPWRGKQAVINEAGTSGFFMDGKAEDLLARVTAVSRLVLSTLEANQSFVLIPGSVAFEPEIKHKLVDGTRVWEILEVSKVEQGAKVPLYILKVGF